MLSYAAAQLTAAGSSCRRTSLASERGVTILAEVTSMIISHEDELQLPKEDYVCHKGDPFGLFLVFLCPTLLTYIVNLSIINAATTA